MKAIIHLELEFEIDFDAIPAERMTRHYPGCPAHIELNGLEVITGKDSKIDVWDCGSKLHDYLIKTYEDELMEACWEEVEENEMERAVAQAEHFSDLRENR